MLHFGIFDIRTDVFVLLIFILAVLVQLLLCFKVKKKIVRLMPMCLSLIATIIFAVLAVIFDGWDRVGWFFLAGVTAFLLCAVVIAWGIWYILRKSLNKRKN